MNPFSRRQFLGQTAAAATAAAAGGMFLAREEARGQPAVKQRHRDHRLPSASMGSDDIQAAVDQAGQLLGAAL